MGIPCKRSCGCKTALLVMKEADIVKEISDYHKISESNALRNQSAQWNDRRFGIPSLLLNDMQSKHHGLKLMCLGTGIFFPYVAICCTTFGTDADHMPNWTSCWVQHDMAGKKT